MSWGSKKCKVDHVVSLAHLPYGLCFQLYLFFLFGVLRINLVITPSRLSPCTVWISKCLGSWSLAGSITLCHNSLVVVLVQVCFLVQSRHIYQSKKPTPLTSVTITVAAVKVSWLRHQGTSLFSVHGEHWHLVLKSRKKAAYFASQ